MNDLDLFEEPGHGAPADRPQARRGPEGAARKRRRRRRMNGRAAVMFSLAFLVAVFGGGGLLGLAALEKRLSTPDYTGEGAGRVTVQIMEGDTGQAIGRRLEDADVVKSSKAYVRAANKDSRSSEIQPGYYAMRKRMSGTAALALLLDPKSRAGNQIILPEGLRVSQVIKELVKRTGIPKEEYEAVVAKPEALDLPSYADGEVEGYLWPGRYDLDPEGTAESILKTMVDRFKKVADDIGLEERAREANLEPQKVITMASLIQAESGRPSDMPKISRVIYNRFEHDPPMYLKFDSTTLYGLKKFGIVASNEDIKSKSPYNTYNHAGLPPGPISNPGEKAIDAVFEPAEGTWLFFVATDPKNKITEFATTDEEFTRLRDKLNDYLRENGGG
ncbi:endolytic transglycosylase MltG [Thermomonospora umbrina]|uniref:Endolytic murein transglycosylase n=1 Tax=Thermomonospora umbrina TaxID=111806 RepID=A0A3D9T4C6_9ACTN|nr:endolytic transglycosylase MltG [Thermomonospora umbrina]REF01224.1 UPF0755 protein [Thermomonospora umbrina]